MDDAAIGLTILVLFAVGLGSTMLAISYGLFKLMLGWRDEWKIIDEEHVDD